MSIVLNDPIIRGNFAINERPAVLAATTAAGTLATDFEDGDTIDGVTLATGDRILIKNQASGVENGIYVVEATGAPTRAYDLSTGDSATSINVFVQTGTANGNTAWVCTTAVAIVDTNSLVFTQYDVVSTLRAGRGGTGVTTFGGTNTILYTTAADTLSNIPTANSSVLVTSAGGVPSLSTTLPANLTIGSPFLVPDNDSSQFYQITGGALTAGAAANSTITFPADGGTAYSDIFTLNARTQTLTNKTLTTPRIVTSILDTNGNTLLGITATASAVNQFTIANAATGTNPIVSATGTDTNIGLDMQIKGTGAYRLLGSTTAQAQMRFYEQTTNGTNYTALQAAANIASDVTYTLPAVDGSSGDFLTTNGSGVLSFVSASRRISYMILNQQANATSTTYTTIAYFDWNNSRYSAYTSGALVFEVVIGNRNLDIRLRDLTAGANVVESTGINTSSFQVVTGFTNPSANGRLALQIRKSANGGNDPEIYACQLEWNQ